MFGSIGNIVGGLVGGIAGGVQGIVQNCDPTQVALSAAKMLQQTVGQAVCMAANTLTQVAGMPKFIAQEVGSLVNGVLGQLVKGGDAGVDDVVRGRCGNGLHDFAQRFADGIVKDATQEMEGKGKGGSWFEALAKALGKALDAQAGEVKKLSDAVQGQNASDNPSGFTDLQAASQRMSFMMSAADQVLKTIGEGLGALARK